MVWIASFDCLSWRRIDSLDTIAKVEERNNPRSNVPWCNRASKRLIEAIDLENFRFRWNEHSKDFAEAGSELIDSHSCLWTAQCFEASVSILSYRSAEIGSSKVPLLIQLRSDLMEAKSSLSYGSAPCDWENWSFCPQGELFCSQEVMRLCSSLLVSW